MKKKLNYKKKSKGRRTWTRYKSERRQRINPTIDYKEQGTTTHDRWTKFSSQGLPKGSINCQEDRKGSCKDIKASGIPRGIQGHGFESSQTLYTGK